MKLRNKKTGEILGLGSLIIKNPNRINCESIINYDSLAELNEDWEDYDEPKSYWYYDTISNDVEETHTLVDIEKDKEIGNYFETEEEAEKALEKLRAWKRLKDARFKFTDFGYNLDEISSSTIGANGKVNFDMMCYEDFSDDLELLFGGEK